MKAPEEYELLEIEQALHAMERQGCMDPREDEDNYGNPKSVHIKRGLARLLCERTHRVIEWARSMQNSTNGADQPQRSPAPSTKRKTGSQKAKA